MHRVKHYADRFLICFQLEDTLSNRIRIEDELSSTYRKFYKSGAVHADVALAEIYQFHVDTLTANIDEQEAERLRGGVGDAADNLEIDAVVQEPEDNERNYRYLRREAQRNAAPDNNPGDDSDGDDDDDDDWAPGNKNPGGPGGNDNNDNDDEVPATAGMRRRNGDAPGDGDPPPPGGGAAIEDDPRDYSNRDINVPRECGADPFEYTNECRLIRRALYLCKIPDRSHAKYFVQAGITTFANLAEYDGKQWNNYKKLQARVQPYYAMTNFHVKSLTAISLWVKTKIIHGSFDDVNSLSIGDVDTLVLKEVCVDVPSTIATCPKLAKKEEFPTWKRQMYLYLESQLTEDNLRMSYIVRPRAPPTEYDNLMNELEFVIPNDGSMAVSKRDSDLVYGTLYSNITDDTAKTRIWQTGAIKNGRLAWTSREDLYVGKNNLDTRILELQKQIDRQSYTSNGSGNAEKVTTRLSKYYSEMEELMMPKTAANKLQHLRGRINMGGGLKEPYYISVWQGAVDDAILKHMSVYSDLLW